MKKLLIVFTLSLSLSSYADRKEFLIADPFVENILSETLTKSEENSLEHIVDAIKYNEIELPRVRKNFYLKCLNIRVQYVFGIGGGSCSAVAVHSSGKIEFTPANLYIGYIGAGFGSTVNPGSYIKVNDINSFEDFSTVYFSTDSGAAFIGAINVKHSTISGKGKTSLGDVDLGMGFFANLISMNLSYVYISKKQRLLYFYLNEAMREGISK